MKQVIHALAFCFLAACANTNTQNVRDGIYLVADKQSGISVTVSPDFRDDVGETTVYLDTNGFVPLRLASGLKLDRESLVHPSLLLTLESDAAKRLSGFTARHIGGMIAVVVDGQALTLHTVRAAITRGSLRITRCGDNACEKLEESLRDNVW